MEALITDLHPSGEGPEGAQFFDSIADGLSRCRETAVFGVTASALRQIQFSRWALVESNVLVAHGGPPIE